MFVYSCLIHENWTNVNSKQLNYTYHGRTPSNDADVDVYTCLGVYFILQYEYNSHHSHNALRICILTNTCALGGKKTNKHYVSIVMSNSCVPMQQYSAYFHFPGITTHSKLPT